MCISQAANSIGLKEIPKFKVEMGDEQDWITKNQVSSEFNKGRIILVIASPSVSLKKPCIVTLRNSMQLLDFFVEMLLEAVSFGS